MNWVYYIQFRRALLWLFAILIYIELQMFRGVVLVYHVLLRRPPSGLLQLWANRLTYLLTEWTYETKNRRR
jgi:hypothetical protein